MEKISIGLIGVGEMGKGIGHNLLKNGCKLFLANGHSMNNIVELEKQGACIVNGIEELCENTSVIILCLPSSKEVESVCMAMGGLLQKIKKGSLILDCTTAWPDSTISLSNKFNKKGVIFIDSPLTRTPVEAMEGRLNCIFGGDKDNNILATRILSFFCENIFYAGSVGEANKLKLFNNGLSLCAVALVSEIVKAAAKTNIDLFKFREIVSMGGANTAQFQGIMKWLLDDDKDVLKFSLENAIKDLGYLEDIADRNGIEMSITKRAHMSYESAIKVFGKNVTLPYLCGYPSGSFKKQSK